VIEESIPIRGYSTHLFGFLPTWCVPCRGPIPRISGFCRREYHRVEVGRQVNYHRIGRPKTVMANGKSVFLQMFFVRVSYHMMCTAHESVIWDGCFFRAHVHECIRSHSCGLCVGDFVRLFSYRSPALVELCGHSFVVDPIVVFDFDV